MGVENHDIKTLSQTISSTAVTADIGAVPAGMKRYVTFLRVENVYAGLQRVFIASLTTAASVCTASAGSGAAKIAINLAADEDETIPPGVPDVEHPLFSIAAGHFLGALTTRGEVDMFVQYYDA